MEIDKFKEAFMKSLEVAMFQNNRQLGDRERIVIDEFVKQIKVNKMDLVEVKNDK